MATRSTNSQRKTFIDYSSLRTALGARQCVLLRKSGGPTQTSYPQVIDPM